MSRIGKNPIPVAAGVDVAIQDGAVRVKGPQGELTMRHHPDIAVAWDSAARQIKVTRPDDGPQSRALHGLTRALVANMVNGVQKPYEKSLEIQGVGYQASVSGTTLNLQVGYANTIKLPIPKVVKVELPSPTQINLKSIDKHAVGQFAANIRNVRPVEPYKGKGIRYVGEQVKRKAGKAFAGS
ncbi:MAG: 50S ribosomal protein L6 [Planctomycetaceae bacterium]